jgi:hypothetical protein
VADESNRRDFLRHLVGQVARGAGEMVQQALGDSVPEQPDNWVPETLPTPRAIPAPIPGRCASLDEVCALADQAGLAERRDEVLSICRWSLRLTPRDAEATLLDTDPDGLRYLLELDLAAVGALGEPGLLPPGGQLTIFAAQQAPVGELNGERSWPCAVLWSPSPPEPVVPSQAAEPSVAAGPVVPSQVTERSVAADPAGPSAEPAAPAATASGHLFELTPELVLPRVWSDPVQALGLDPSEQEAWELLRHRLAESQDTLTFDESPDPQSLHRLLGYPDERNGNMPLACEMLAQGIDLHDEPAIVHPRAEEFEAGAARWLLLAQLSDDWRLDWSWGTGDDRLYFWIHEADLAAGDFTRVRAFVQ